MNNQQLAEDSTGYSFNASTGELIINKKVNGTIHIVSGAVEKVATYVPVYHSEFGCKVTADPIAIIGGSDYTCTVEANNPDTQAPQIVSVAFNGVVVPQSGNYEFTFKSGNAWQLLIHSSVITTELKEIYFSVVAVDKPQEDVDVVFDGGTYCEGIGITTAKLGSTFECRIEPKEAYSTYEVKIVSVVMNGTILDSTKYSYNQQTEGNNFKITPTVTGDIHIVASAQEPASTDHAVAIIADTGLKVDGYVETVEDGKTYSCTITALDYENQWGRIPFVTMGGIKLNPTDNNVKGYTYDRESGVLTIDKPATADIVIVAVAEDKETTTFQVEGYCFESKFNGQETYISTYTPGTATTPFTATIAANNPETKTPNILQVKINGESLPSTDYTFTPSATGDTYTLTIANEHIDGDIFIAVSVTEKERSTFNVTIYKYNCTVSGDDHVSKDTEYKATVTSIDTQFEPYVFSVTMGSQVLVEDEDYTFDHTLEEDNLVITKKATGDIVVCATTKAKTTYSAHPTYAPDPDVTDGMRITGIEPDGDFGLDKITDVVIPNEIEVANANNVAVPVTSIDGKGILYGCSKIERLTIPFIGTKKSYTDTDNPYDKLFGKIFGSKLFVEGSSLTWQSFYMDENENEDSYRITKAAIPVTLSKVVVNGGIIPQGAFSQCNHISIIEINNFETDTIGAYAFNDCLSLHTLTLSPSTKSGAPKINTIEWRAFEGCSTLGKVDMPDVNTIKHHAFTNCAGITMLSLPLGLVNVGTQAFSGVSTGVIACAQTRTEVEQKIYASQPTWAADWVDDTAQVIYGFWEEKAYISDDGNWRYMITRKDGTTTTQPQFGAAIVEYLGNDRIEEITIPGSFTVEDTNTTYSVTEIGAGVFYAYSLLQKVHFGQATSLQFIGNFSFMDCKNLTTIDGLYNTALIRLGNYAFNRCGKLVIDDKDTTVAADHVLPSSVTDLGIRSFGSCKSLKKVYLKHCTNLNSVGDRLFYECGDNTTPANPTGLSEITLPTVLRNVGSEVFTKCYALTSLTITVDQVDTLPDSLCEDCFGLTTFTWGYSSSSNHLVNIGSKAFKNCTKLENVYLNSSTANTITTYVMTMGDEIFANCTSMTQFSLGKPGTDTRKSNFSIGRYVFLNWLPNEQQKLLIGVDTNEWATYHSGASGTVILSFGWVLAWGQEASILGNYYWQSGDTGSAGLYIRDA